MSQYFRAENTHPNNQYQIARENNPYVMNPSDVLEGYINDEYVEDFRTSIAGQPGLVVHQEHRIFGELVRGNADHRLALTVSASIDEISAANLEGVTDVYITATALLAAGALVNGIGGGYDGRVLVFHNRTTSTLVGMSFGHMASNPTPGTSRIFVTGAANLAFVRGGRLEAHYHGGDGLWYLG